MASKKNTSFKNGKLRKASAVRTHGKRKNQKKHRRPHQLCRNVSRGGNKKESKMKHNGKKRTYQCTKIPLSSTRGIALRGENSEPNHDQLKYSRQGYRDIHPPPKSILERLLVTLYLCISFAQGKVFPPHLPEPQGLTMAREWQGGWFEKFGCHPENDEYQQNWRQREARHVEEQSVHSDTNPYEEHENRYDEEPSENYGKEKPQKLLKMWKPQLERRPASKPK